VPAPAPAGSLADVPAGSAELLPSVVKVLTSGGNGSGVVYTADGLVLTNEHVVRGASTVQLGFADGRRYPGTVQAVDVITDLALVQTGRRDLPVARFRSELPVVGELAIAIGSPLGFENSVTAGVRRTAATEKVHAGVTHAREIASDKVPAVKEAVQERRGLAIAVTVLGYLLLRRLRGRRRRTHDAVETS
jgi:S1-C subfamily serine protease